MMTRIRAAVLVVCLVSPGSAQEPQGTLDMSPNGATSIRVLLDEPNVGPEVSVAEMTFAPIWVPGREAGTITSRWIRQP